MEKKSVFQVMQERIVGIAQKCTEIKPLFPVMADDENEINESEDN